MFPGKKVEEASLQVARKYKGEYFQLKYAVRIAEKYSRFARKGALRNGRVIMTSQP